MKSSATKQKKAISSKAAQGKLQAAGRASALQGSVSSAAADSLFWKFLEQDFLKGDIGDRVPWMKKVYDRKISELENLIKQLQKEENAEDGDLVRLTLNHLGVSRFPNNLTCTIPKNVKAAKLEALGANLHRCVRHLEKLADGGDHEAIELLAHHALGVIRIVVTHDDPKGRVWRRQARSACPANPSLSKSVPRRGVVKVKYEHCAIYRAG